MLKKLSLAVISLVLSLVVAELLLRAGDMGSYSLYDRVLFYSFPSFVVDGDGVVRYAPEVDIRAVAVYGDQVDYDVTNRTNNLGFYDPVNYGPVAEGVRRIVFVGDSFTAGSGGFPWVSHLRQRVGADESAIFGLGVGSASVYHMAGVVSQFSRQVGMDEVNVLVISNDMFRPYWRPVEKGQALWFCPESGGSFDCTERYPPIIHRLHAGESREALVARAAEIYQRNRYMAHRAPTFVQSLNLYNLACDAYNALRPRQGNVALCPHLRHHYYFPYAKDDAYYSSIAELLRLAERFPQVKFRVFHIPEKGEAILGEYSLDLAGDLAGTPLEYVSLLDLCPWDGSHYYKHDAHPNPSGYTHLLNCVGDFLFPSASE